MSRFYVVNESTEDTLGSAENLPDAICTVAEQAIARRVNRSGGEAALDGTE